MRVKIWGVIEVTEMTQFMQNYIIDCTNVLSDQPKIQCDEPGLTAAAPLGAHFSDFQLSWCSNLMTRN